MMGYSKNLTDFDCEFPLHLSVHTTSIEVLVFCPRLDETCTDKDLAEFNSRASGFGMLRISIRREEEDSV